MADELILKSIVSDERITATFSDEKLPRYARIGELFITDGILYVYAELDGTGSGRWLPLTDKKEVYTFEQIVEQNVWTIPYDYHTDNLQVIVYDHERRVHPTPYTIDMDSKVIKLTFDEPTRGEAYIIVNRTYEWFGEKITIGENSFVVQHDTVEPTKAYLTVNTEFVQILEDGYTTFKNSLLVESNIELLGNQTVGGNLSVNGDTTVNGKLNITGNISSPNITDVTTRVGALETLTSSDDFNLDTIQEIVDFIKVHQAEFDALTFTWDDLENKPTTVSGFNITDAYTKIEVDSIVTASIPTFETLEGKPTTTIGYGITDAVQVGDVVTLTGGVTGSAGFDSTGNVSIDVTVTDDSHNHVMSNIDGLQAEFENVGTYEDFTAGYNSLDNQTVDFALMGTVQDFVDGLNGL